VFPIAVARWLAFSGHYIAPAATLSTDFIFTLSGLFNSILYVVTRPDLVKGSNTDCREAMGHQFTLGTGEVRRKTSREQNKNSLSRNKNRSLPKLHGLGHLPDRSEDDIREQEGRTSGDADDSTWVGSKLSPPRSMWRSRDSLDSASGNVLEDAIKLGRLRSISVDGAPIEEDTDRHFYRKTSSSSQRHLQPQRKFESPGLGFLPDVEADLGRDYGMGGHPFQPDPVQAVGSRQGEDQTRWMGRGAPHEPNPNVLELPPEQEAAESVRWSRNTKSIPRAL